MLKTKTKTEEMLSIEWFVIVFVSFIVVICVCMYLFPDDSFQLKCIVSSVDGNKYCVRDRSRLDEQEAVDLIAKVVTNCRKLVEYCAEKFPDKDSVQRLVKNFNPERIMETLPTSTHTAYSENKGEKIAFCLNEERDENTSSLIDEHTLTFVAIHELSHLATESIGHKPEFWTNFKFLLEVAKDMGIHNPVDYQKSPKRYCGMDIQDNPYYE